MESSYDAQESPEVSLIHKYESLKRAAELSIEGSKDFEPLVDRILNEVVLEVLRKYQQKISVGIQDSFSDLLVDFKANTTQEIFNTAGRWKIVDHEPFLFPKDCRFCYQRGNSIVVVIEQNPQVRTLLLDRRILAPIDIGGPNFTDQADPVRLPIALPYVVFVIHFRANVLEHTQVLSGIYTGWRISSLKSINDELLTPLLPNVHSGLTVCMGHTKATSDGPISQQVEEAITFYWSSRFNNDLSKNWWLKKTLSSKLASGQIWSENSQRDSTFILAPDIIPPSGKTVQDIVSLLTMHEEEPDESKFRHQLSENIDVCVSGLSRGVDRYLKKTKFEKFFPKDVKDLTGEIIKDSMNGIGDTIMCLEHEIQKLAGDLAPKKIECIPRSRLWHDYQEEQI